MPRASLIWNKFCPVCNTEHETRILTRLSEPEELAEAREYFNASCEEWFEAHLGQIEGHQHSPGKALNAPAAAA